MPSTALRSSLVLALFLWSAGGPPARAGSRVERVEAACVVARRAAEPEERAREEARLLAAFTSARAGLEGVDGADGGIDALLRGLVEGFGAVEPGKRAVLAEALVDARGGGSAAERRWIDALWALEELELAPDGVAVVALDTAAGPRLATRLAPTPEGVPVALFERAALEEALTERAGEPAPEAPDAAPDSVPAPATKRFPGAWPALALAALALGIALDALMRREGPRGARRRADFFTSVTHALKTPLATIRLCADTLAEHGRDDPAAVPRFAAMIRDETERLQARIHQVLQLAAGRTPAAFGSRRFDAASALPAIVAEALPGARAAGVRLVLWAEGRGWVVAGSVELFAQALGALLDNAIQHGGPGTVLVAAHVARGTLHVAVQDRGPGLPPAVAAEGFEPFARAEGDGTALGLAIAKRSLAALGGRVRLDAEATPGATFRIELPLARRGAPEEEEAA